MSTNKSINMEFLARQISRRDFLKFCGLGFLGLTIPEILIENNLLTFPDEPQEKSLGRVINPGQKLFTEPDFQSDVIKDLTKDSVFEVTDVVVNEKETSENRIWYELERQGYSHSKYIQPVYHQENTTNKKVIGDGCLGEITIPFVDAYKRMDKDSQLIYRLYYASTYWVTDRGVDDEGEVWYQILDDRNYTSFYVPAVAVRLVPKSELLPISPEVPWENKKIDVNLATQKMTAYEGEEVVFASRISSGVLTREGGFSTPKGYYRTTLKRPCRHMAYPADENYTGYDLPGVPWVSYFTSNGVAFHGTYWHNDFGVPHSHGCINLTPQAAKWVYLWTTPAVLPNEYFFNDVNGTRVIIH